MTLLTVGARDRARAFGSGVLVVGLACAAGATWASSPVLGILLLVASAIAIATIREPVVGACIALASLAVTVERLPGVSEAAYEVAQRGSRILVLAAFLPLIVSRWFKREAPPLVAMAFLAVLAATIATARWPQGFTLGGAVWKTVELAFVWAVVDLAWKRRDVRPIAMTIAFIPVASVVAGWLLGFAGWADLTLLEYATGIDRLQGASIPAFLGLMGVVGCAAAVLLIRTGSVGWGLALLAADLVVTALTVTRGAIIAAVIVAVPTVIRLVCNREVRVSPRLGLARGLALLAALGVAGAFLGGQILERNAGTSDSAAGIGSGREEAWRYFAEEGSVAPLFGRGAGATSALGEANVELPGDFRGAHNEYLELFVDYGAVGGALVLVAIVIVLSRRYRETDRRLRLDLAALLLATAIYSVTDNTLIRQYALPFVCIVGLYAVAVPGIRTGASPRERGRATVAAP